MPQALGSYMPNKVIGEKSLIVLSEWLLTDRYNPECVEYVILHEVAHFHLQHKDGWELSEENPDGAVAASKQHEEEANRLAKKWQWDAQSEGNAE